MVLLIDIFSINRSRWYENPILDIIVIELCLNGGCPLEEAHEYFSLIQSFLSVVILISFMCYCGVILVLYYYAGNNLMQYASGKCQVSNELKPWKPMPTKASKPKILCIALLIWEVLVHETWLFLYGRCYNTRHGCYKDSLDRSR
jgi:hypothetical protein